MQVAGCVPCPLGAGRLVGYQGGRSREQSAGGSEQGLADPHMRAWEGFPSKPLRSQVGGWAVGMAKARSVFKHNNK